MTKTTTKPDAVAQVEALQAQRAAAALAEARVGLADVMPAFDALEPVFERVKPLAADFEHWRQRYGRDSVRREPGIEFLQLDMWLAGSVLITQFPGVVARARALYAELTVEGSAYTERRIRNLLRSAESILAVEDYHRSAQDFVEKLEATLARRVAAGTIQPPAPQGLAPATSEAVSRGPRRAASGLSDA